VLSTIVNKRNVDDKTIQSVVVPSFLKTLGNLPEGKDLPPREVRHLTNINKNIPKLSLADFDSLGLDDFYQLTALTKAKMGDEMRGKLVKYLIDIADDGTLFTPEKTVLAINIDEKGNTNELTYNNIFGTGARALTSGWSGSNKSDFHLNAKTGEVLHDSQLPPPAPFFIQPVSP